LGKDITKTITTLKESAKFMRPVIIQLKNDDKDALVFTKRFSNIFDFLLDDKKFEKLMKSSIDPDDKAFDFLNTLHDMSTRIIVALFSKVSFFSFIIY